MERAEAEAIYGSGRDACVQFILDLAARVQQLDERLARLEAQAREDSRTSSRPPSSDPPKTRAQRRAEARAKAKELMRREGEQRKAGGQSGHRGVGRELRPEDQIDEIVDHYPQACGGCGREFTAEEQQTRSACWPPPLNALCQTMAGKQGGSTNRPPAMRDSRRRRGSPRGSPSAPASSSRPSSSCVAASSGEQLDCRDRQLRANRRRELHVVRGRCALKLGA
jgi:Family of unknown function (DUF6444)